MLSDFTSLAGAFALGYLFGSIPFAVLIARLFDPRDIRNLGTGNPGAANVFRQIGPIPGLLVGLADMLKGLIPVLIVSQVWELGSVDGTSAGIGAVLGHQFSFLLRFRGGAGLATVIGAVGGLLPGPFLIAMGVGAVLAAVTRNMGWSGGLLVAFTFALSMLAVWTSAVAFLPEPLTVHDPSAIYGGLTVALLLLLRFWARLASEWWQRRTAVSSPPATRTMGDHAPPGS